MACARVQLLVSTLALIAACSNGADNKDNEPTGSDSYPDTVAGLARLMTDIVDATRSGDVRAEALLEALELPDHQTWFAAHFGKELGADLAAEYQPVVGNLAQMQGLFEKLVAAQRTEVKVERFEEPKDPAAVGYQSTALEKMTNRLPLYSARFTRAGQARGFHLWSFAYVRGGFRWVGMMKKVDPGPIEGETDRRLLRLREQ